MILFVATATMIDASVVVRKVDNPVCLYKEPSSSDSVSSITVDELDKDGAGEDKRRSQ